MLATVTYKKVQDDLTVKKVKETYCVDAMTFAECEARMEHEFDSFNEMQVVGEQFAPFREVFFTDNADDDKWFKATLEFIIEDAKTGKEKKSKVVYLVQASSIEGARKNIDEMMGSTMIDYVTRSIAETKIIGVFEVKK